MNNKTNWENYCNSLQTTSLNIFEEDLESVLYNIKTMLSEKNRKYGDAALNPIRIFSKSDNLEQLKVRLDDKLSRVKNQQKDEDEDVIDDLIGYLILYKIAKKNNFDEKI